MFKVLVSFTCFEGNGVWLASQQLIDSATIETFLTQLKLEVIPTQNNWTDFWKGKMIFCHDFWLNLLKSSCGINNYCLDSQVCIKFGVVCTSLHLFTLEIVSNTMEFLPQAYKSFSLGSDFYPLLISTGFLKYPLELKENFS